MTFVEQKALGVLARGNASASVFGSEMWSGGRQVRHGVVVTPAGRTALKEAAC